MAIPQTDIAPERQRHPKYRQFYLLALVLLLLLMVSLSQLRDGVSARRGAPARPLLQTPADAGLPFRPSRIHVADDEWLAAWELPVPAEGDGSPLELMPWFASEPSTENDSKGTVLVLGEALMPKSEYLSLARVLGKQEWSVCLFDYRGQGESPGGFSISSALKDAGKAFEHAANMAGSRPLVIYGAGLGANLALEVAAKINSGKNSRAVRAVIVDTPVSRPGQLHDALLEHRYGKLPGRVISRFDPYPSSLLDTENALQRLKRTPVFLIHSAFQKPVDFVFGLYQDSPGEKQLWVVPEAAPGRAAAHCPLETAHQLEIFLKGKVLNKPVKPAGINIDVQMAGGSTSDKYLPDRDSLRHHSAVEIYATGEESPVFARYLRGNMRPSLLPEFSSPPRMILGRSPMYIEPVEESPPGKDYLLSFCGDQRSYLRQRDFLEQRHTRLLEVYEYCRRQRSSAANLSKAKAALVEKNLPEARLALMAILENMAESAFYKPGGKGRGLTPVDYQPRSQEDAAVSQYFRHKGMTDADMAGALWVLSVESINLSAGYLTVEGYSRDRPGRPVRSSWRWRTGSGEIRQELFVFENLSPGGPGGSHFAIRTLSEDYQSEEVSLRSLRLWLLPGK